MTRRFPRDQLFNDLREPLRRALERLFPLLPRIDDAWRASLGSLVRRRQECKAVAGLSLRRFQPLLAAGDFDGFAAEMEHQGQALAARGVAEEHAFLALALYLEHALLALAGGGTSAPELSAAVARLVSVAQLYLQAGYANAHAVDRQALEEQYRLRLGRDLHDEIGHNLVVLKMYMEQMAADFARARGPRPRAPAGDARAGGRRHRLRAARDPRPGSGRPRPAGPGAGRAPLRRPVLRPHRHPGGSARRRAARPPAGQPPARAVPRAAGRALQRARARAGLPRARDAGGGAGSRAGDVGGGRRRGVQRRPARADAQLRLQDHA